MTTRTYNMLTPHAEPDHGAMLPPVLMPTQLIPCACKCSWAVVTAGPGLACVSRLKRRSAMCSYRHEPAGNT